MCPERGIAAYLGISDGRKDVGVGGRGVVEVPMSSGEDLAGGWVEAFDVVDGWVGVYGVDQIVYSEHG